MLGGWQILCSEDEKMGAGVGPLLLKLAKGLLGDCWL